MKNILLLIAAVVGFATVEAQNIIPLPRKMMTCEGTINANKLLNVEIPVVKDSTMPDEAYRLDITRKGAKITCSSDRGEFNARQTLQQVVEGSRGFQKVSGGSRGFQKVSGGSRGFQEVSGGSRGFQKVSGGSRGFQEVSKGSIPCMHIEDQPQYGYRGFMLDVSRHFFTVDELKKMIDVMARYKMNVFHWHLTDDHGWRAEIKKYPKLTSVGSVREDSWNTDFHLDTEISSYEQKYYTGKASYQGKPYGPYFYTQDEMREIVKYCAERQIDVLPEVDMPGHFKAAMAAYPEFSCTPNEEHKVWTAQWGVNDDVLNVGNPLAIQFAEDIVDELCDIFPYPYIHIGGDECPTSAWEKNQQCLDKMKTLGLKHVRALQSDFILEIANHLRKKGKKIVCWNESVCAEGADLDRIKEADPRIYCWVGSKAAAKKSIGLGLDVVLSEIHASDGSYYINRRPSEEAGEPDGAAKGDDTVEKTYTYNPLPDGLSAEDMQHVKGVQATFWTEWVSSNEYLEYLALPKLICVAEAGWTAPYEKNWKCFRKRMTAQTKWLDAMGYLYSQHWMESYKPRK